MRDFRKLRIKKSSAQITKNYRCDTLVGKQTLAVINVPPKQIGPFISEVPTLRLTHDELSILLIGSDTAVPKDVFAGTPGML
jgi:tRNA-binding protein